MGRGPGEELAQRGEGARRHDVGIGRGRRFYSGDHDLGRLGQAHAAGGLAEEGPLAGIRFNQRYIQVGPQGRDHQPRETAAAPQIHQALGLLGYQR